MHLKGVLDMAAHLRRNRKMTFEVFPNLTTAGIVFKNEGV